MKLIVFAALAAFASGGTARASSGDSWAALFAQVKKSCIDESGIKSPEASAPVVFDDATDKLAVLLRGKVGRGKAQANVAVICLYDKESGKASVAEYTWPEN